MIYLDEFDIFIYTTVCPRTSIIFISKANEKNTNTSNENNEKNTFRRHKDKKKHDEIFTSVLLGKLLGHKTSNSPSIFYV